MRSGRTWRSLVLNHCFIAIYHHLSLNAVYIPNQRFIVVYYGLSLIAMRDGLRIQGQAMNTSLKKR